MLILTRNAGQSIVIDNDIIVRILQSNGGQIKVGISAPEHISVHREEVWWRIQNEIKNNNRSIYNPNNPEDKDFCIHETYPDGKNLSLLGEDDEDEIDLNESGEED